MMLDDSDAVNFVLNLLDESHRDVQVPEALVSFRTNAMQCSADCFLAYFPELLDQNFAILQLDEASRTKIDEKNFNVAR